MTFISTGIPKAAANIGQARKKGWRTSLVFPLTGINLGHKATSFQRSTR